MPDPEGTAEELNREYVKLVAQYTKTSDVTCLERALGYIAQAVEQTAGEVFAQNSTRASHLTNLGRCRGLLFEATGNGTHLDESITAAKQAVQVAPESSRVRPLCHVNCSDALAKRYFSRGAKVDFDEALEHARMAVTTAPEGSEYFGSARSTLASRLAQYFEYIEHDDRFMDEAIQITQDLVEKTPADDGLYYVYVFNLAGDLHNRYQRYGHLKDLFSAKENYVYAMNGFPKGNHNHVKAVRQFASVVNDIADATGEGEELESAIQKLIALEPNVRNEQELAELILQKSRLYATRYILFSNVDDLDLSVTAAEEALHHTPKDSSIRGIILQRLSNALASRAELRMSLKDIDTAIDYAREIAEVASGIPARDAVALDTLARRFMIKYQLFGGVPTLKAFLDTSCRAVDLLPKDHKDRPMKLHLVAICLRAQFEHYGEIQYLDRSIAIEREVVDSLPIGSPDRCMALDGLSHSLSMRYKLAGNSQDLEEAIIASEAAVDIPPEHKDRPAYLNGLSNRLRLRFDMSKNRDDLDRAIAACAESSLSEAIYLVTLSNCLSTRYGESRDPNDLDRATEVLRECLCKLPASHPMRINALHNLGLRLQEKYQSAGTKDEKLKHLEESLDIATQCVDQTPEGHPSLAGFLKQLATRQLFLATLMDHATDEELMAQMRLAASTFEHAFNQQIDTPLERIQNGELGGYLYMQGNDWEKANAMLTESVSLFRRVSPRSLDDNDRQRQLRGLSGISSLACACFIALGEPEKGLEVLEAGRGIMANISMGYHADLLDVRDADPGLCDEYIAVRNRLSQPLPEKQENMSHGEDMVAKRNADLVKFEALEAEIRGLPGLETFNQSMRAEGMQKMAAFGPIVAFCTVDQRCDALIVTPEKVEAIPLPDLKHAEIKTRIGYVVGGMRLSKMVPSKRGIANKRMRTLLEWLWDKAVQPVLYHLDLLGDQELETQEKKRLWWVTSGPMGLLPLHAAGKGQKVPAQNTYARVISSYALSFSTLKFARNCEAKVDTTFPAMALITMPQTPGGLNPLATEAETQAIHEAFASSRNINPQLRELCQPSAAEVLTLVRGSSFDMLHLACHAEPNLSDPSNTALLFGSDPKAAAPDPLPIRQLRRLHTSTPPDCRPPRLAYLSACCTAQQYDLRLIDENIHLASAFQLCGFPGVIGTLWEADDDVAVVVAKVFYKELFRLDQDCHEASGESHAGDHIARALDFAIGIYRTNKNGRDKAAMDALAWANFIHIGA